MQIAFNATEGVPMYVDYVSRCDTEQLCDGEDVNVTWEPYYSYDPDVAQSITNRTHKCCDVGIDCLSMADSASALLTPNVHWLLVLLPILQRVML